MNSKIQIQPRIVLLIFSFFLICFTQAQAEVKTNLSDLSKLPDDIWVKHDVRVLEGADLEQYYSILHELRCPVCQGQSLAESDSGIALDLKSMVYEKIAEGYREDEIKKMLIDRYGYYINFKPPVNKSTFPLWVFPFLIAVFGVLFVIYRSRTKRPFEKWK